MSEPRFDIVEVDDVDCVFEPQPWRFAIDQAEAIDRHWAKLVAERPALFDGRVLLQHRGAVETDASGRRVFRGAYLETGFKAFLAWRDFGHPVRGVRNGFAMAALRGADGGFLLGEMAQHTANAGKIYFPSGTPDRSDLVGDIVDIDGSARRELAEETGLDLSELHFEPGFTIVQDDLRVCCMKAVRSHEDAATLAARIHAHLMAEPEPELVRMHVVRNEHEITPRMPAFVAAYLRRVFAAEARGPWSDCALVPR